MELSKKVALVVIFVVSLFSEFGTAKADMAETIASMILFVIFAMLVFAGIGWWQKRAEKS